MNQRKASKYVFETIQNRGGRPEARGVAWRAFLIVGALALLFRLLLPEGPAGNLVYPAFGVLAAAAILIGVRLNRPGSALPWYALLAGQSMLVVGDVARGGISLSFEYPSVADGLTLGGYAALTAALALVVRGHARKRDLGTLLDATILAVAVGLAAWYGFLGPYVYDPSASPAGWLLPVAGVIFTAGFAWLAIAPGRRPLPLLFFGAGLALVAVGDAPRVATDGASLAGSLAGYGWLAACVLWGTAALHPAMIALSSPENRVSSEFTGRRAGLLAGTFLVVPAILIAQQLRGEPVNVPVIAGGSVVLFALLLVRLDGLARREASVTEDLEHATRREKALGASASALVAATDRQAVYGAALDVAQALLDSPDSSVRIVSGSAGEMSVAASSDAVVGGRMRLPAAVSNALLRRRSVSVKQSAYPGLVEALEPVPDGEHFFAPLTIEGRLDGAIVASTGYTAGGEDRRGIESLGVQVSTALERIERTEERHQRLSEERFESLTQDAAGGVAILESTGAVRYAGPSFARTLGRSPEDVVGRDGFTLAHPGDAARARESLRRVLNTPGESQRFGVRMRHADGSWRQLEMVIRNLLEDPNVRGVVVNSRDITERKQAEEKLSYQALHDPLTSLPNRDLLVDRLGQALARTGRRDDSVAVIYLDLDRFKLVNDSLGHEAGDRLLVAVGKRLKAALRPEDTVAHLGGDEFVVLMEDVESVSQVIFLAERVVKLFETPFMPGNREAYTTVSAGIALSGSARDKPADLLRNADIAMHRAKSSGKSRFEVFDAGMASQALRHLERDTALRRAIERQEFTVYYQPKFDLITGGLHGFEALARWEHPERGLVPPSQFIPLAEESGMIVRIGHWILEESCRRAKVWQERYGAGALAVSVNLSARQFEHPNLPELVAAVLEETGLAPNALLLEVTESAVMEKAEKSRTTLADLKDLGVRLAIDDFGTGYSSLAYLKRFPLDMLKVDRSFVNGLGKDRKSAAIVEAVCALGRTLEMQVLAEGIETADQAERLRALGCELGQGYYFARPLPQDQTDDLISKHLGASTPPSTRPSWSPHHPLSD